MDEQKQRAAATISLLIIVAGVIFLSILAAQIAGPREALGDRFAGRQFILLAHIRSSLDIILAALPAIISFGLSVLAGVRFKDWQFYTTIAVTVGGVLLCIYMVMELADPVQAQRFWAYSPVATIDNYESFTAAAQPLLVGVGAWFVGVLGVQLGVTAIQGAQPSPAPDPAPGPGPAADELPGPATPFGDPAPAKPDNGNAADQADGPAKPE